MRSDYQKFALPPSWSLIFRIYPRETKTPQESTTARSRRVRCNLQCNLQVELYYVTLPSLLSGSEFTRICETREKRARIVGT